MNLSLVIGKNGYSQFISDLVAARGMLSLVSELRQFFRHRVTLEQAREDIKKGLDQREQAFLDLARALIYERGATGQIRLSLVVHPQVEHLDETKLYARFRTALSTGSRSNHFMTKIWENTGTLRIKRAVPLSSARGKVLPLHISLGIK
jgi:hypothetical protein